MGVSGAALEGTPTADCLASCMRCACCAAMAAPPALHTGHIMMRRRIHACRVAMAAPPALYRGHIMRRRIHACIPLLAVCRKVEGVPVGVEFVSGADHELLGAVELPLRVALRDAQSVKRDLIHRKMRPNTGKRDPIYRFAHLLDCKERHCNI